MAAWELSRVKTSYKRVGNGKETVMALTHEDDTQYIDGPHPPILQDLPDLLNRQSLTIMHIGLRGVVSNYSVDHDDLFPTKNHLQSHNQD